VPKSYNCPHGYYDTCAHSKKHGQHGGHCACQKSEHAPVMFTCPPHYERGVNNICLRTVPPMVSCPKGTVLDNGECVALKRTVVSCVEQGSYSYEKKSKKKKY
jgi:hypothetical protein